MKFHENTRTVASGYVALVILPLLTGGIVWMLVRAVLAESVMYIIINIVLLVVMLILFMGFFMVHTNPVSYTHLTLPTIVRECRSRWAPSQ